VRRLVKGAAAAVGGAVLAAAATLTALTVTEWWPAERGPVAVARGVDPGALPQRLKLVTWNLGYAALDREADFFMDGGHMSRARSRQDVEANLAAIVKLLRAADSDVTLLQELDERAHRSCDVPERDTLFAAFPTSFRAFTPNYRVPWVPVPLFEPMGGVRSGIATLSRAAPLETTSLALPGRFAWPNRLFNLKRVALLTRLRVPGESGLIVINVHLSAFDKGGWMRREELAFLRQLLVDEAGSGWSVIAGGDWNSSLPGTPLHPCPRGRDDRSWLVELPAEWTPPGWRWAVDHESPTVRTTGAPLNRGSTCYAGIDGFLVSPGVEIESARVMPTGFANTDHLPLVAVIRLP